MKSGSHQNDPEKRRALDVLLAGERFLLAGHVRPDGDCVGSQGALARGLRALGKEVVILNPDHPGPQFDYLYDDCPFEVYEGGALPEHDVSVLLDINELSRTGPLASPLGSAPSRKLVIDHHLSHGEPWWDAAFIDTAASATGILVWEALGALGVQPDAVIARAVFTSIVTDTGWFRYSNTDADTLEVASELVRLGVEPARIFASLHQRNAMTEPIAIAGLLSRLEYFGDGRIAVVDQPLGAGDNPALVEADPVLDILRSVHEVEVVLYLREIEPGVSKLSARSKTDFDVNALARQFGGGGHRKASGATIRGDLREVRERLVAAALAMQDGLTDKEMAG